MRRDRRLDVSGTGAAVGRTGTDGAGTLGASVRRVRLGRGLTLVRLAEAAGLSHSFLSQIERGMARPSMASLDRIAAALGTSVVELMAGESDRLEQVRSHVLRAGDGAFGPYGLGTGRILGPELLTFVPMEVRGTNTEKGELHRHAEDEFLYVLAGAVVLDLDGVAQHLAPGDAATISARTAHRWWSAGRAAYRLIVVKEAQGVARLHEDLRDVTGVPGEWS